MAGKSKGFHGVEFAKRYGSPSGEWFNAFSAIIRAEILLEDAIDLRTTLEAATPEESRYYPWYAAEAISYYAVGYVTCLEWHARSRLRDLLTFKPAAATIKDINQIKESVVLDMLEAQTTVPGIVAGTTSISSLDAYLAVFERVFKAIGVEEKPFSVIKEVDPETGKAVMTGDDIARLKELHPFRHNLVHEIGIPTMGHPNIRDSWTPDRAVEYGHLVLRLMRQLERKLTEKAPWNFPNLLGETGFPVSRQTVLLPRIAELERRIGELVSAFDPDNEEITQWSELAASADRQMQAELRFLNTTGMLFYRYEDLRTPLMDTVVQARHDYLKAVVDLHAGVWGAPPLTEAESNAVLGGEPTET